MASTWRSRPCDQECQSSTHSTRFIINETKSAHVHSQLVKHFGALIDTSIGIEAHPWQDSGDFSDVPRPHGRWVCFCRTLPLSGRCYAACNTAVLEAVSVLVGSVALAEGVSPGFIPPSQSLTMDSSNHGWRGGRGGGWQSCRNGVIREMDAGELEKSLFHIDVLETLAVIKGLQSFQEILQPTVLLVQTRSTTVLSYLN